jgi:hypothetical protein
VLCTYLSPTGCPGLLLLQCCILDLQLLQGSIDVIPPTCGVMKQARGGRSGCKPSRILCSMLHTPSTASTLPHGLCQLRGRASCTGGQ